MMISNRILGVVVLAGLLGPSALASDLELDPSRLGKSVIRYRDHTQIPDFPTPVVYFRAAGLSSGAVEIAEIKDKIVYPLIEKSRKPIAAIVVQRFAGQPDGIGVTVLWSDGEARESTIARTRQGHYDATAYQLLFAKPTP